jgi:hypothetical protein
MRTYLIAAAIVALALPALASAKGPASALVTGPGIEGSLVIRGNGEVARNPLGTLAASSGLFAQVFGQSPDPTSAARPAGRLGPRYRVVYLVPGPEGVESRIVQLVYPFAKPVVLTYVRPGQIFWDGRKTHGGWYQARAVLKRVLVRAGLPARAPT